MITKLLDGLEMFLDVCGTSSNSNNLLALQVELAGLEEIGRAHV